MNPAGPHSEERMSQDLLLEIWSVCVGQHHIVNLGQCFLSPFQGHKRDEHRVGELRHKIQCRDALAQKVPCQMCQGGPTVPTRT